MKKYYYILFVILGLLANSHSFAADDAQGQINSILTDVLNLAIKVQHLQETPPQYILDAKRQLLIELLSIQQRLLILSQSLSSQTVISNTATTTGIGVGNNFYITPPPSYDLNAIARAIHDRINQARVSNGLTPLAWSESVTIVAADHNFEQAYDNAEFIDTRFACEYPIIRHESFDTSRGYNVSDRLIRNNIYHQRAGENIIALPIGKNWTYRYTADQGIVTCPEALEYSETSGTYADKYQEYQRAITSRRNIMPQLKPVTWVNQDWKSSDQIAQESVDAWMNSAGHRANILYSGFRLEGIGVNVVGNYIISTEVFVE